VQQICCVHLRNTCSFMMVFLVLRIIRRQRPYRVECTGSLPNSEVKRRRARLVLGWGTAREDLRVLLAFWFGALCRRRCSTHRTAHAARLRRRQHRGNEKKQNDAREFRNRFSKSIFEIEFRNRFALKSWLQGLLDSIMYPSHQQGKGAAKSLKKIGARQKARKSFFL
jgi:hypothetical protein